MKWNVFAVKDGVEDLYISFETEEAAKAWVENYNTNRQRPREFVIRQD